MTAFRWAVGVVTALMAAGSLLSFGLYMAGDADVWLRRTRRFRHWTWLAVLLWFNVEVWRPVLSTLIHWNR